MFIVQKSQYGDLTVDGNCGILCIATKPVDLIESPKL